MKRIRISEKLRSLAAGVALVGWMGVALVPSDVRADVVLIAYPDVTVDTLDLSDLRLMYLGKMSRWPDDTAVQPAVMKSGEAHKTFVTDLLRKTPSKFSSYWKQILFTGRGIPPKAFSEEQDLVSYVRETPGAIGYVSKGSPTDGVTALALR